MNVSINNRGTLPCSPSQFCAGFPFHSLGAAKQQRLVAEIGTRFKLAPEVELSRVSGGQERNKGGTSRCKGVVRSLPSSGWEVDTRLPFQHASGLAFLSLYFYHQTHVSWPSPGGWRIPPSGLVSQCARQGSVSPKDNGCACTEERLSASRNAQQERN